MKGIFSITKWLGRHWFWIAVCVLAVCLALNVSRSFNVKAQTAGLKSPVPYTVVLKETVLSGNGSIKGSSFVTWAVRSDGSRSIRIEDKDGTRPVSQRIIDFNSGRQIAVNDLLQRKSTTDKPGDTSALWLRDPQSNCLNSIAGRPMVPQQAVLGEEVVGGYRAVKVASSNTTWWFALDYGCAMLKSRSDFGASGASEKTLVSFLPGEPSTTLFEVANSFVEGPPSALTPQNSCSPASLNSRDESYYKYHPIRE